MDNLMLRRRVILSVPAAEELYPIGTDIITKYIGRDPETLLANLNSGYVIDAAGNYITGDGAASPVYIPIDPNYRYQKTRIAPDRNSGRIYKLVYYDENYNFIRANSYNSLNVVDLSAPPSNAKYLRFYTSANENNWTVAIVRIS